MAVDYVIAGAGLFGATCARLLTDAGKKVIVIEKRDQVGGNCADELKGDILVGKYGGHIFHTNNDRIWKWVNRFTDFTQYEHRVKAKYQGKLYSFPVNRATFDQFNLPMNEKTEEILRDIFFTAYSEKQWGRPINTIPKSILKRIPFRDTYDDRYFSDKYQGMPVGGYTKMIEKMLDGIEVKLKTAVTNDFSYWRGQPGNVKLIYTGPIDAFYDYKLGELEYRSLEFRTMKDRGDFQGCATVNYADAKVPYTRTLEWKHYYHQRLPYTYFTYEYPRPHASTAEPYYPIRDKQNTDLFNQYKALVERDDWLLVGGRLGSYQYLNMDQAIGQAMKLVDGELKNGS